MKAGGSVVCAKCAHSSRVSVHRFFLVIMAPKDVRVSGDIEGDWVDVKVASLPTTTTGCLVQWHVYTEMRHWAQQWADLPFEDNCRVEASFMTSKESVTIGTSSDTWTFDVVRLIQRNDKTGTERPIRRAVIVNPTYGKPWAVCRDCCGCRSPAESFASTCRQHHR